MLRIRAAVAVALVLTLILPGATLAATQNSTATVTVTASLTFSGMPTTLAFGSTLGGQTLNASGYAITLATNNPAGVKVYARSTAFSSGGASIGVGQLRWTVVPRNSFPVCAMTGDWTSPGKASTVANQEVCAAAVPVDSEIYDVANTLTVPAGQTPGLYTGTLTLEAILQ